MSVGTDTRRINAAGKIIGGHSYGQMLRDEKQILKHKTKKTARQNAHLEISDWAA